MDYFQILQVPRAPWLDEAVVRDQFQRLAGAVHPDSGNPSSEAFVALNQAWQTLKSPTARLRHYLELEHPEALAAAPSHPAISGDLFMEVAGAQQEATSVAAKLAAAQSPLTRAVLESARSAGKRRIDGVNAKVVAEIGAIHLRIQAQDQTPATLAAYLGEMVFLEKWAAQLREKALGLA